jgi:hypothetical protein
MPKCFMAKKGHQATTKNILAKPPKSSAEPIGTISDLAKLIFNPDTTSKHKKIHCKL